MSAARPLDPDAARADLDAVARRSGALLTGVATADAFGDAPEGRRPVDLLPRARSVLVLGGATVSRGQFV